MISALAPLPARSASNHAPPRASLHSVDGLPSATRAGLSPSGLRKRELPNRSRRASPSEHCNEEVIDYFGRCVEPAAQADADPMDVEDHRLHGGRSWPIDYRRGF